MPVRRGERGAEIVALPAGLPTGRGAVSPSRGCGRRFQTAQDADRGAHLRRSRGAGRDDGHAVRHPGHARVVTTQRGAGPKGVHELWISEGAAHPTSTTGIAVGTSRPSERPRAWIRASTRASRPSTSRSRHCRRRRSPAVHPSPGPRAQNVLATGPCWVSARTGSRIAKSWSSNATTRGRRDERRSPDYHVRSRSTDRMASSAGRRIGGRRRHTRGRAVYLEPRTHCRRPRSSRVPQGTTCSTDPH